MLKCEGYMMFYGVATVTPKDPSFPQKTEKGTWLYKPEYDCWYVNGSSYPYEIVGDIHEINPPAAQEAFENMMGDTLDALERLCTFMENPGARESYGC